MVTRWRDIDIGVSPIELAFYTCQGIGWFFWTAKTEENCAPEWDFLFLLEQGIAPADLCQRDRYCSFDL